MEESNVEEIPEEEEDYSEDIPYNTQSWGADLSFRDLILRYEEGELIKPEIQRNYIWDKKEASRFIESLLLNLPIPSIFLAKKGDNFLIVDGFQRITTVFDFYKGVFSKDGSNFKLLNSDGINEKWRGKSFAQLTQSEKRRILSTTIHAIIFNYKKEPNKKDTILYQVFKRINESGRTLTPQEIRNCVYQGEFNSLLKRLNEDKNWRKLYGKPKDSRMKDLELILRIFALSSDKVLNSEGTQISLSKELNYFMASMDKISSEKLNLVDEDFREIMNFILNNIGEKAFHNYLKDKEGNIKKDYTLSDKVHPTILDSISIATIIAKSKGMMKGENLEEKRLKLLKNDQFIESSSIRTTNLSNIHKRINLALKFLYGIDNVK